MLITDNKKISLVKRDFSQKFQNLKLEFYKKEHEEGEGNTAMEKINQDLTIGEIRTIHNSGELSINGHLKVSTLEQSFLEDYGLNVQVFRKSGGLWLQTTSTDNWTLSEQNTRGRETTPIT
jgi:hypothetical protein